MPASNDHVHAPAQKNPAQQNPAEQNPAQQNPAQATHAVVLVAHGSRHPDAARDHAALCVELTDRTGTPVHPAFLELNEPSIIDACAAAAADCPPDEIVWVVPYFVHIGNHTTRDIPAAVDAAREVAPGTTFALAPHIGSTPEMRAATASVLDRLAID